MKFYILVVN